MVLSPVVAESAKQSESPSVKGIVSKLWDSRQRDATQAVKKVIDEGVQT